MSFPVSAATNTTYQTLLGTQYRYDGLAWQLDTTSAGGGATGLQGVTGIGGSNGAQGATGVGATNDGYAVTFTDALSVAQRIAPASYAQLRCDQTTSRLINANTWTQFSDFTGDMSSSTMNLSVGDKIIVGNGGDGTYCVGFSSVLQGTVSTWYQVGLYKDGVRVAPSLFSFAQATNQWINIAGANIMTLAKDSTLELYYTVAATATVKTAPWMYLYAHRIGR